MLGDDGNQIGAHSAFRTLHSALERLFSGIHFGMDVWGNRRLNPSHIVDLKAQPMNENNKNDHYLPSREFAYDYTVAMYFAQLLESNLRAILKIQDDHCYGMEIELNEKQLNRFKSTKGYIDRATLGLLIGQLQKTGTVKEPQVWMILRGACGHQTKLAHFFLAEQNFDRMTKKDEAAAFCHLHEMTIELYQAMLISRTIREQAERFSAKDIEEAKRLFEQF